MLFIRLRAPLRISRTHEGFGILAAVVKKDLLGFYSGFSRSCYLQGVLCVHGFRDDVLQIFQARPVAV